MKFGPTPLEAAEGTILAHSLNVGPLRLRKGRRLSSGDIAAIRRAGLDSVVAARLEAGDVHEDEAAAAVAGAIMGEGLSASTASTGRTNLMVEARGILVVDGARLDALNAADEALTVATLPAFDPVGPGQMAATVKVIPFAVSGHALGRCLAAAHGGGAPLLSVAAFRPQRIGLVQTSLPGMRDSLFDKTRNAVDGRLAALECPAAEEVRCFHEEAAVADAIAALRDRGCAIVLVSGASAIVDRRDVVPAGIVRAGGAIDHFGMPVDPGNLILLARVEATPVLGLPGCARSPKLNGFDWVLRRLVAGLPVSAGDVMGMGVGGLLKEIPARPLPRAKAVEKVTAAPPRRPRIAAVILAAGQSRRMGRPNKLLLEVAGKPMVVHVVEQALASRAGPVIAVTGYQRERIEAALSGLGAALVHNAEYAAGLSASLRRGLTALPPGVEGVVVCLADMPRVTAMAIDRLIGAFDPGEGRAICVPTWRGKRGNPVLFAGQFVPEMQDIGGDVGGRHLIGQYPEAVHEVAMDDLEGGDGVLLDLDTPQALAAAAGPGAE